MKKDQFTVWFTGFIVLAFSVAGILDILDYMIVKLILYICISLVVANVYYVLFIVENEKSPEEDSE
jgi:membrane protein DedA with SNARE-associated domain